MLMKHQAFTHLPQRPTLVINLHIEVKKLKAEIFQYLHSINLFSYLFPAKNIVLS